MEHISSFIDVSKRLLIFVAAKGKPPSPSREAYVYVRTHMRVKWRNDFSNWGTFSNSTTDDEAT